ncbi:MAG: cellulase family glycosylhydrolase [Spirochaetales bacterium]|nr:cellulase family glycosylhydrolase [Spirochaetales bacterium]
MVKSRCIFPALSKDNSIPSPGIKLNYGINLGGYLSQCEHSQSHYESFITEHDIMIIASWGFDHVRVPVDYILLEDEDGNEKDEGFKILERLAFWCENNGLNMILDLHKTKGYDFSIAGTKERNCLFSSEKLQQRFISLWEKISEHYGEKRHIAFELLNEVIELEHTKSWNNLIEQSIDAIRAITTDTIIIYGGLQWNSVKTLQFLKKPRHKNIIFTFHFYEPLVFTHQKAYWVPELDTQETVTYPGDMSYYKEISKVLGPRAEDILNSRLHQMDRSFIEMFIQEAIDIAEKRQVPLYCGEYGVIDRAPTEDTLRWYRDVHAVLEKYGIGHCAWNYKSKDFGLFDSNYDSIREKLFPGRKMA